MKQNVSRRNFLKGMTALGLGSLLNTTSFAFAEALCTNSSDSKVLILLNTLGGLDDRFCYPYTGSLNRVINSIRPTLAVSSASFVNFDGEIGIHRLLDSSLGGVSSLGDIALSEKSLKLIHRIGFQGSTFSHNDDQNVMSIGAVRRLASNSSGWLARIIESCGTPVFGLGTGAKIDFAVPPSAAQPILSNNLSTYKQLVRSSDIGGWRDSYHAQEVARQIIEKRASSSPDEARLLSSMMTMYRSIEEIQNIANISVNSYYPDHFFGNLCKDAARIVKHKAVNRVPGRMIIYLQMTGYDTHSNQIGILEDLLPVLGQSLSALVQDLKASGMWDKTAVYQFSEFGRTLRENGSRGTDHASASTHLLVGGGINKTSPIRVGSLPSSQDISGTQNYLQANIDFRNVLRECLSWIEVPSTVIDEVFSETYPKVNLGLFA